MTWWRRDPSLSPINRIAQRLLRSHESALRTRCFSRAPSQKAQHEDNDGSKRPSGMSHLEWMQMQHYNRWRKRFTEDPYQALFGASHDMLSGRGLKDWEWISKTFPKWMLREMEADEDSTSQTKNDGHTKSQSLYPKKVDIVNDEGITQSGRDSYFRQPCIRATRLDRDDAAGIISPSDLRRPREQPHTVVNKDTPPTPLSPVIPASFVSSVSSPPEPLVAELAKATLAPPKDLSKDKTLSQEESVSGLSFMEQFLAEQHRQPKPQPKRSIWRETALQRRSAQVSALETESKSLPLDVLMEDVCAQQQVTTPEPPVQVSGQSLAKGKPNNVSNSVEQLKGADKQNVMHNVKDLATEDRSTKRSTSSLLSQLPKDDIDFLSADDIRASMGSRRSCIRSDEEKSKNREKLEATFSDTQKASQNIDPMIESKIINDQLIRRVEREMQPKKQDPAQTIQAPLNQPSNAAPAPEAPIESTVGRLVNLVSSHFWQVPAEAESIKKTRIFFEQFMVRVHRGRNAMKQIVEDLEKDLPASKELLKTLQEHDEMLESTVRKLQRRLDSGDRQATVSNQKTNERLHSQIKHTDSKLEIAFTSLNEIELPKNILASYKRRLRTASKVATRNLELTRQIAWSMQTHLEDPEIDRTILAGYQVVANNLLVVKHTQLALTLLLDRAMHIYGVPKVGEGGAVAESPIDSGSTSWAGRFAQSQPAAMSDVGKAQLRVNVAVEERLTNEVDAQISAMKGLSDDGYSQKPKPITRKLFEDRNPLAHSLFRPFGPVIESLEKEASAIEETNKADEIARKKTSDAKLVAEVRKAYEDTYGPITVGHKQLADAAEQVKREQTQNGKSFSMLKDDDVSNSVVRVEPATVVAEAPSEETASSPIISVGTPGVETVAQHELANTTSSEQLYTTSTSTNGSNDAPDGEASEPAIELSPIPTAHATSVNLATHYTILVHDPESGKLSITTSKAKPPRDTSPPLPLHKALASLDSPAKFISFITDGLEIVSAKKDVLVLRDAQDDTSSTRSFETVSSPTSNILNETIWDTTSGIVNPIDGTARLSPTGYVGPEESQEQLEKDFEERRKAAGKFSTAQGYSEQEQLRRKDEPRKRRGGAGGVVKTAIWAAAVCYVAGVIGEIVTGA